MLLLHKQMLVNRCKWSSVVSACDTACDPGIIVAGSWLLIWHRSPLIFHSRFLPTLPSSSEPSACWKALPLSVIQVHSSPITDTNHMICQTKVNGAGGIHVS